MSRSMLPVVLWEGRLQYHSAYFHSGKEKTMESPVFRNAFRVPGHDQHWPSLPLGVRPFHVLILRLLELSSGTRLTAPQALHLNRTLLSVIKTPNGTDAMISSILNDRSPNQFVIVRLDRTIQCFLDSPIKSGNDVIVATCDVVYNFTQNT